MGKIGEKDFEEMVARLRTRAIGLMRQLDEEPPAWRALIEEEVARRRTAAGPRSDAPPAPTAVPSGIPAPAACTTCGTKNDADARFCKQCGARLIPEEAARA
jgi:hypothetical protein